MQSHIPSSWKDVKIENTPTDDIKLDVEKRKRKRTSNSKNANMLLPGTTTHKHHKTNLDTRKQDIYASLDSIDPPGTADKYEAVQNSVSMNTSDIPSNRLLKSCIGQFLPVLPLASEKLDKMLFGMTKNLEQIVTGGTQRDTPWHVFAVFPRHHPSAFLRHCALWRACQRNHTTLLQRAFESRRV